MTRTVLTGGRVFDGTGADPAPADVAVEDGRIVGVGTGLDGDDGGRRHRTGRSCPGFFDCHVHADISATSTCGARPSRRSRTGSSRPRATCAGRSRAGSPRSAMPAARTSGSSRRSPTG